MADSPYVIVRKEPPTWANPHLTEKAILIAKRAGKANALDVVAEKEIYRDTMAAFIELLSASPSPVSLEEVVEVLKPFADAWLLAKTHPNMTLGQMGALSSYEVSGVHFQRAESLLSRIASMGETK